MIVFLLFVAAIGTLVGSQIAELLTNTERYISRTVNFLNDTFGFNINAQEAIDAFNDPDGAVQQFIEDQQDDALALSVTALGWLLQLFSVILFTFYLVADGPRLRRAICTRLTPDHQERVLQTWELASTKTGGYLYSRALLALLSTLFHWIVFQSVGTAAPIALALWVGIVSQFLPVVGTYIAGVLPVVLTFLDSPLKALIVLIAIVVYQQIENYVFAPRITARTMQLHPALAFGSALAGAALLGAVGAVLALPAAAMAQALVSELGTRHTRRRQPSDHRGRSSPATPARLLVRLRRRPEPGAPRLEAALMLPGAVVPIAETTRSGVVESVHFGAVVALAADGIAAWSAGDPDTDVYPRSALKPLQAQAMFDAGFAAEPDELAVAAASHSGEPIHLDVVRRILAKAGLDEDALGNTPALPLAPSVAADVLRAGGGPSSLLQNCSGKHAAMLSTSVANGWDVDELPRVRPPRAEADRRLHRRGGGRRQPHRRRRVRRTDGDGHADRAGVRRPLVGDPPVAPSTRRCASIPSSSPAPGARTPC